MLRKFLQSRHALPALCCVMTATMSWAQESGSSTSSGSSTDWQFQHHGQLSLYATALQQRGQTAQSELRWQARLLGARADGHSLHLEADLQAGRYANQARLGPSYYRVQTGAWQITAGLQNFDWAVTDTVSPSDLLNPRDWRDVTRPRKQPLPALALRYEGPHSVEWVISPGGRAAQLPQGAWQTPSPLPVANPRYASPQTQTALRYTSQWKGTDVSAVLYHGHAYAPIAQLGASASGAPQIQPLHDRLNAIALGATRQIAPGTLMRAEWAQLRHANTPSFRQTVLSIDHEWAGLFKRQDSLYALLQWQASHDTGPRVATLPGSYDFRRLFNKQLLARLQYKPDDSERWQWSLETSIDPKRREGFTRSAVKHRINDSTELELGWLALRGKAGTFWGQYAQHDRLYVELRWQY